ncbi:hypothetical protein GCM10027022_02000 [Alpinimonas psychrophila]
MLRVLVRMPELMPKKAKDLESADSKKSGIRETGSPTPALAKKARVSRRVKWIQPGSTENPASSDTEVPERDRPENWGDRATRTRSGANTSNDEQLRRDKPPHWG